jgi:hypothetical protein
MTPISPGVYSQIHDFSEYVAGVPGTIAFIPFFADKGADNEMSFISSKDYLIKYFGETPYNNFGTKYAMAHELAKNYLDVASSAYLMRVLPKDAKYANLVFDLTNSELDSEDPQGRVFKYRPTDDPRYGSQFLSLDDFTGINLKSVVRDLDVDNVTSISGSTFEEYQRPLFMFYPTGRGEYYNNWYISFTSTNNPKVVTYTLYEKNGEEHKVLESFDVSFDPEASDYGESIFIVDILNTYSENLRAEYNYTISELEQKRAFLKYIDEEDVLAESVPPDEDVMVVDEIMSEPLSGADDEAKLANLVSGLGNTLNDKKEIYIDIDNALNPDIDDLKALINDNADDTDSGYIAAYGTNTANISTLNRGTKLVIEVFDYDSATGNRLFNYNVEEVFDATEQYRWIRLSSELSNDKEGYYELSDGAAVDGVPTKYTFANGIYAGPKLDEVMEIISNFEDIEFDKLRTNDDEGNPIDKLTYFIDDYADYETWLEEMPDSYSNILYSGYIIEVTEDTSNPGEYNYGFSKPKLTNIILDKSTNLYYQVNPITGETWEVDFITYIITNLMNKHEGQRIPLQGGSSGTLKDSTSNKVVPEKADELLVKAYSGDLNEQVLDTDGTYFTVMFDAGYNKIVKDAMVNLASIIRRDCMAFLDIGNNSTPSKAITMRKSKYNYNTYHAAMYDNYCKVYLDDIQKFTWVTPIYQIARIIPYNDFTTDLWYAPAGFNRAIINDVHELRYYLRPRSGDMDQLYLNQINPIVRFTAGYTVWGQLTSQRKSSKLSDIHAVRTLLYIKRAIEQFCKYYIFEHNNLSTWNRINKNISMFLSDVKDRGGLQTYTISVGASEYQKKRKIVDVQIGLEFPDIIEKIMLNFNVLG